MKKYYLFQGKVITLPYTYVDGNQKIITSSESYIYEHGGVDYEIPQDSDEILLAKAKDSILADIDAYDTSSFVNSFEFDGRQMWIDKTTRASLFNAANAAKSMGMERITIGLVGESVTLPVEELQNVLCRLEMYALECYNVTLRHKNEVEALTTVDAVYAYDICEGYPSKLIL